uniref:Gamma-tubulin complex component 6 n=1 Tax=Salarias fasciatus TaxID=181472 RepID=A0A672FQJ9_SALFA
MGIRCKRNIRALSSNAPSPVLPLPLDSQKQLVSDLLNVLIGVASTTFPLNQSVQFDVRPGVCVSGASPESVSRLLAELAQYGTYYLRLSRFSLQSADKKGLVFQAFTGGLRKYLHYYRACVLSTPCTLSLLTISFLFRKVGRQLRYLSELCCVDGPLGVGKATFPVVSVLPIRRGVTSMPLCSAQGVKLLSYLYNEAQSNCSNENYPVLLSLLKSSCAPYTRFVSDWVYSGVFRDVYGEFMIQVNEEYLSFRDKHFWVQGYTLISKDVEDCVPIFLKHIANDVYVCGKTINLLKICCPQHYICWSELPAPRITVTFSLREVEEIERDCAVYRGRMERIAKHSAISREQQALRTEQARQELINQVRESAVNTLESIRGRQVSQRLAEEARKRERFEELKQHLEQEQEWRNAAKKKQEEDDFSFARELRDREKRLQALEEQLEQRARKELIAQYSRLSEEAARRERRAMWRVQRMRLHDARAQFFQLDRQETEAILEKYPLGQGRPPIEALPPVHSEYPTQELPETQASEAESPPHDQSSPSFAPLTTGPALICEKVVIDFPPQLPNPDSQQVDAALQDIGSDLPDAGPTPRPRWGPVVQPNIFQPAPPPTEDGVPQVQDRSSQAVSFGPAPKSSLSSGQGISHELQNSSVNGQESVSQQDEGEPAAELMQKSGPEPNVGIKTNEEKSIAVEDAKVISAEDSPSAAGDSGSDRGGTKPLEADAAERSSDMHDQATESVPPPGELTPHSSAHLKAEELVSIQPSPSVHGHSSDAHIKVGEYVSGVTAPLVSPSIHGHASDSHIKIGGHVSDVAAPSPSASVYGHSSESHIKVGANVSEVVAPLPAPNVHGHISEAHIRVGELVSDVDAPLPSASAHGHSSDAHIKVGENVSDFVAPLSVPNIHGHASDANIKVGEFVSDVPEARPRWSKHGHASDCALQPGCVVSGPEQHPSPLPGSAYGHSSDSTLATGCVVSGEEPKRSPLPGSAHGHSSDSTLGIGCVVSKPEPLPSALPGSLYGHASDSTLGVGCTVLGAEPQLSDDGDEQGRKSDVAQCKHVVPSEQLFEGMGSWAAGEGPSPGERAEQEYLLALSAQYQVEHYDDCSDLMAASPECRLLKQVTRGPWGLPMDPTLHRATDTTAVQLSEMVSLPVLIKHSVTTPLITHVSLVNKAVVDYFFVELGVERHFEALRHFLLMEDGEFAQSLSDLLFEKLGSGQTPGELLTPLVLNSILSKALQYSLHGDTPLAGNFTFALRFLPDTFHPHAPDSLNCLELRYKVDWPLNIIITDSCMNKYNRLFSFLLQLKHMVWSLRDVWFHLKRTALVKGAGRSVQFRQLQLYRHEMQHFVKVIQGYIANQILQVSWSEFTAKLAAASDLDAIHRTHADYLNRAIFRGLLTEKAAPVMNIIHSIFSLILKFRAQLIAQPWDSQQGEAVHPSFIAMQQSYNTFKYYSHFLFKVVTKLVNRGYQPHLEDFLLRINFNNYYKDS